MFTKYSVRINGTEIWATITKTEAMALLKEYPDTVTGILTNLLSITTKE